MATVIGREAEIGSIEAFLARVEGGPTALVLSGEAGIGKTILWETGVEEVEERFGRVLLHRSVEAEALLSFTGLSDLLAPVFEEVAPMLAPLRRRALEVSLLLAEPGNDAPDSRAIGLALLDVLQMLAEQDPVVLALDDLQWLDPSSAGVLQIALRRLRDERVGVLATVRTAPETTVPGRARSRFRCGSARAAPDRPLEHGGAAPPAEGASRSRSDPAGARPGSGGVGRQPVLRARARAGARPDGLQTDLRAGPCRCPRASTSSWGPPRPAPDRHGRRRPLRSGARPPDGRARRQGTRAS